jgi:hypothetical protein
MIAERMFALMRDTARERPGLTRIQALNVNMVNVYSPDDIEVMMMMIIEPVSG